MFFQDEDFSFPDRELTEEDRQYNDLVKRQFHHFAHAMEEMKNITKGDGGAFIHASFVNSDALTLYFFKNSSEEEKNQLIQDGFHYEVSHYLFDLCHRKMKERLEELRAARN